MNKGYRTQWVGQFAVASVLTRRGYLVSMPLGNVPNLDLQCQFNKKSFSVQVKSLSSKTSFLIQERLTQKEIQGLYFVFIYVPPKGEHPLEYFILSHKQLLDVWKEVEKYIEGRERKRGKPLKKFGAGIHFKFVKKFKNNWGILPH